MPDYMLSVLRGSKMFDVQVNGAPDIREAIRLAEGETKCRVDHGRGGILPLFSPGIIIDAATGYVERIHDEISRDSGLMAKPEGMRR